MKLKILALFTCFTSNLLFGQEQSISQFDFGRMWTFEQAPTEWFNDTYDMNVDQSWFDDVRKSSLKFASWCSASFVSPTGLIMTNHHCSREVAISVQSQNENFDKNGFYANSMADERRVDGLFVEQLIKVIDITDEVKQSINNHIMMSGDNVSQPSFESTVLKQIESNYSNKEEWKDLRLQTVSFYSGGKYSLYGYKKFEDIRLVLIPENDLGFYGGDPDNFTYPRYNLDCTFWRAYDEMGKPLDTSENYYEFNIDGIEDGTPVFVIGNPGRTERYRTTAQLEFDRDYRYKHLLTWLTNRRDMMQQEYNMLSSNPAKEREAQDLLSTINNFSNSIKAYNGIMGGLHNEEFMGRKANMEKKIILESNGKTYWADIANEYKKLEPHAWAIDHLSPSEYRGKVFILIHELAYYKTLLGYKTAPDDINLEEELSTSKETIQSLVTEMDIPKEKKMMTLLLEEIKNDIYPGDNTYSRLLGGETSGNFISNLFQNSKFLQRKDVDKFISKNKNILRSKDPLIEAADVIAPRFQEAVTITTDSRPKIKSLEEKVANQAFEVFGTDLPPDATFTLRISDGIVKGYEYNGTTAPIKTTYLGLYDRYYSNDKQFPWSLPEKWENPPMELLQSPLNFISTNDIIGGNSGSAIINQKGEAVGLIFDGNIESLPGNFIFDEEYNRSVSVHAGGIYAAMKYIYKADRIINELIPNKL